MAKPTHKIVQIEERGKGKKPYWREVGVGFANSDGSINLSLSVIPLVGTHLVQLRPIDEQGERGDESSP